MWDLSDEDKAKTRELPFERDAFAYIKILPSPLKANLISGGFEKAELFEIADAAERAVPKVSFGDSPSS